MNKEIKDKKRFRNKQIIHPVKREPIMQLIHEVDGKPIYRGKVEKMYSVICIGMYQSNGKFVSDEWHGVINWLKQNCNSITLYCKMNLEKIQTIFDGCCSIERLVQPDPLLEVYAYQLTIRDLKAWDIVRDYNFNIDSLDSVSYMFFEKDGVNIAELELVDYENYLIIEKEIGISDLHNYIHDTSNNALLCQKGYQDINFLIEGEWKAFI